MINSDAIFGKKLTKQELEQGKSKRGGYTKQQLAEWGVPWPPPKGWKKKLTGGNLAGPKLTKKQTTEAHKLESVLRRLEQFIELNELTKKNVSRSEAEHLDTQTMAFGTCIMMLKQAQKRGEVWKGGYLDNVGYSMEDYVQGAIDRLKPQDKLQAQVQYQESLANDMKKWL